MTFCHGYKNEIYVKFPYYGPSANKMEFELKQLIGKYFPQITLKIAFRDFI